MSEEENKKDVLSLIQSTTKRRRSHEDAAKRNKKRDKNKKSGTVGRPKVESSLKRDKKIALYLNEEELNLLKEGAEREYLNSPSAYLMKLIKENGLLEH